MSVNMVRALRAIEDLKVAFAEDVFGGDMSRASMNGTAAAVIGAVAGVLMGGGIHADQVLSALEEAMENVRQFAKEGDAWLAARINEELQRAQLSSSSPRSCPHVLRRQDGTCMNCEPSQSSPTGAEEAWARVAAGIRRPSLPSLAPSSPPPAQAMPDAATLEEWQKWKDAPYIGCQWGAETNFPCLKAPEKPGAKYCARHGRGETGWET